MIYCEDCKRILLTVQESPEIYVRGEVVLNVLCECKKVNKVVLYEYKKGRK